MKRTWDQKLSSGLMLVPFMTVHLLQFRFAIAEQYWHPSWLITLTFFRTGGNTSLRAFCSSGGSWILSNCRPITFGSFSSPSKGVASPTSKQCASCQPDLLNQALTALTRKEFLLVGSSRALWICTSKACGSWTRRVPLCFKTPDGHRDGFW